MPGCPYPGVVLCDAEVIRPRKGKGTCDKLVCEEHRTRQSMSSLTGDSVDFCPEHARPEVTSAVLDPTGRYRYQLTRRWGFGPALAFVMLNPSTADATADDPTVRRCRSFAVREGFAALTIVNLYAYRTPYPDALWAAQGEGMDIVGPENDTHLASLVSLCPVAVAAWGTGAKDEARVRHVLGLLRGAYGAVGCLGRTLQGYPKHPVRLSASTPLVEFPL